MRWLGIAVFAAAACGGDRAGEDEWRACRSAVLAICDNACACRADGMACYGFTESGEEIAFDREGCIGDLLLAYDCDGEAIVGAQCASEAGAAPCVADLGLALPASCLE